MLCGILLRSLRDDNRISRQLNLHFQNFVVMAFLGGVPTTPDPNTSATTIAMQWEAYRDTNWWCIYDFLPRGGHTFAKYRDRNGRCIAILFKSIGVRGRRDSPEFPKKNSVLGQFSSRPPRPIPLKSANLIFIVVSQSLTCLQLEASCFQLMGHRFLYPVRVLGRVVFSPYGYQTAAPTLDENLASVGPGFRDAAFLLTVGSFLLTVELFYLQLTISAFLLTVGSFLLTVLASLLTIEAFLFTVGKCV